MSLRGEQRAGEDGVLWDSGARERVSPGQAIEKLGHGIHAVKPREAKSLCHVNRVSPVITSRFAIELLPWTIVDSAAASSTT